MCFVGVVVHAFGGRPIDDRRWRPEEFFKVVVYRFARGVLCKSVQSHDAAHCQDVPATFRGLFQHFGEELLRMVRGEALSAFLRTGHRFRRVPQAPCLACCIGAVAVESRNGVACSCHDCCTECTVANQFVDQCRLQVDACIALQIAVLVRAIAEELFAEPGIGAQALKQRGRRLKALNVSWIVLYICCDELIDRVCSGRRCRVFVSPLCAG